MQQVTWTNYEEIVSWFFSPWAIAIYLEKKPQKILLLILWYLNKFMVTAIMKQEVYGCSRLEWTFNFRWIGL